jgi:hypothetical protein
MNAEQVIGAELLASTALTAIVSTRIYHGLRPQGTTVPCINFYRLGGGTRNSGFESATFTVNCRATTAQTALAAARIVTDIFHGTSGRGTYGNQTGFEISRASMRVQQGLIPETEDQLYNAPVEIQMVYPSSSVS